MTLVPLLSRRMKSSIKIIKRKRDGKAKDSETAESEKPVERGTREMVSTVKSWIAELQQRKSGQTRSFSPLTAAAPASQNN